MERVGQLKQQGTWDQSIWFCCVSADVAIKDNMLFSGLPPAGLAAIIDSMQPQMVMAGRDIIKQVTWQDNNLVMRMSQIARHWQCQCGCLMCINLVCESCFVCAVHAH